MKMNMLEKEELRSIKLRCFQEWYTPGRYSNLNNIIISAIIPTQNHVLIEVTITIPNDESNKKDYYTQCSV